MHEKSFTPIGPDKGKWICETLHGVRAMHIVLCFLSVSASQFYGLTWMEPLEGHWHVLEACAEANHSD